MKQKGNEQLTVKAGAVILVIILYLAFFIFPTLDSIEAKKRQITDGERNLAKLKKLLEENPKTSRKDSKKLKGSLNTFVEQKAREVGVTIAYVRPYGDKGEGVEIKVDVMPGAKLVRFVYEMDSSGVTVSRLSMRDYKGNGEWVVKMNLEL